MNNNLLTFRCIHRHSALSHPNCYLKSLKSGLTTPPKILLFDIETAPLKAFVFQKSVWKANVSDEQVISEWFMLCWSAKWLYDDKIMSASITSKQAKDEDDYDIVKKLWELFDSAEIIVAHNGDSFDIPNMNTRFIVQGFMPPSPYQTIDTRVIAKKQFGFTHNGLNALAKLFGLPVKMDVDFELWKRCVDGDKDALATMQEYNKGDVTLLEEVYLKLRPWIKGHPNLGLYVESDGPVCPNCGSSNVKWTDKFYYTQAGKYNTYRCEGCGAFGRSRTNFLDKDSRKNLGIGLAK